MSELIKSINDCLSMPDVAKFLGYEPNRNGFISSPFHTERTASCKLYDKPGAGFCDFSSGTAGDCLKFVSLTQNLNTWESAKMMVEAFSLPINMENTHLTRKKVADLRRQREADQRRKAISKQKWVNEMNSLKSTIRTCEELLKSSHIKPMSSLWCLAVEWRTKAVIRADELVDIETVAESLRLPPLKKVGI